MQPNKCWSASSTFLALPNHRGIKNTSAVNAAKSPVDVNPKRPSKTSGEFAAALLSSNDSGPCPISSCFDIVDAEIAEEELLMMQLFLFSDLLSTLSTRGTSCYNYFIQGGLLIQSRPSLRIPISMF